MSLPAGILIGLVLSGGIAALAYRRRDLTAPGAWGAVGVGTAVFGGGGLAWGILLVAFFTSSALLTRYRLPEKAAAFRESAKGATRDLRQVLANGLVGALLAAAAALAPRPELPLAFLGSLGAVTADTWATEVGVLSRRPPRDLIRGRPVSPGTSGAVSLLGAAAALAGAGFIGGLAALLAVLGGGWAAVPPPVPALVAAAIVGGMAGSLADSLLGATIQGLFWCPYCRTYTERPRHGCGNPAELIRGLTLLDNDGVNLACSLVGAAAGLAGLLLL